ncbi:CapA family protein [Salsuginibacillus kocurii]|uniref:CapA family protein n=1 Tax=Salsuginibacillus kocurii TaxID=427078 RepID=UPI00036B732A|nr:CapA family protein [Salsuginibacillus kocurii]
MKRTGILLLLLMSWLTACNEGEKEAGKAEQKETAAKTWETEEEIYEEREQEEAAQPPMETEQAVDEAASTEEDQASTELVFVGDVMFEWSLEETIAAHGSYYPFKHVSKAIHEADYAVANLETAVTTATDPYDKQYTFKTDPENVKGIAEAGFDLVSLANNHTMDYREKGLVDTIEALEQSPLAHTGAGRNKEEAYTPHRVDIDGETIKILAFSRVLPTMNWYAGEEKPGIASGYQEERVQDIIQKHEQKADYLFVYMHWGTEGEPWPEPYQRTYAQAMAEAGADAIIGAHPHVLQGFEFFDEVPVAYSIGNFLFPDYVSGPNAETGLLRFKLEEGDVSMGFEPYYIDDDVIIDQGSDYQHKIWQRLADHSYNVMIDENGNIMPLE